MVKHLIDWQIEQLKLNYFIMFKAIILLTITSLVLGQEVSLEDLTDNQLDAIQQLNAKQNQVESTNLSSNINSPKLIKIIPQKSNENNNYFGYNYFKKSINFFDNIPTPPNFKLGAGDEIIISLWGETNLRESFVINKDGSIYYKNLGFINLSNQTIDEAESILKKELSNIYSTLNDDINPTMIKVEIEKIRSMNVYFTGQITNPGVSLVHPFSDVFAAIIQAGGIKNDGSLRKIELIRDGKTISYFDFYDFFIKGSKNFSDIRILDGDIIHIPVIKKRIGINGPVYNDGFFELLEGEFLSDLIEFAGGIQSNAASTAILNELIPMSKRVSDDFAKSSRTIFVKDFQKIKPNDGDSITLLPIRDQETTVVVSGRVKAPGEYPYTSSLKEILDIAGGFNDPIFRKSIIDDAIQIIRKDENQLNSLEFIVSYDESNKFKLEPGDKVFIFENNSYDKVLLVSIDGEVKKSGSFQLTSGFKVSDIISLAEGFLETANSDGVIVEEEVISLDENGNKQISRLLINNVDLDFELTKNSKITVLPKENIVRVVGNVYAPGLFVFSERKSVYSYIKQAAGYKPNSYKNRVYVKRVNGEIKKVSLFKGRGIIVKPGDTIYVPLNTEPQNFDISSFVSDMASTLANIAAILIIIDNQNN